MEMCPTEKYQAVEISQMLGSYLNKEDNKWFSEVNEM